MSLISFAKFKSDGSILCIIDGQEIFVPDDMGNRHRIMIAEWENSGNVIEPYSPEPETDVVKIIPSVTFWERLTDNEAEQIRDQLQTQPFRIQQIIMTAQTYRSDHEFWPLLEQMTVQMFGQERSDYLLSQPETVSV